MTRTADWGIVADSWAFGKSQQTSGRPVDRRLHDVPVAAQAFGRTLAAAEVRRGNADRSTNAKEPGISAGLLFRDQVLESISSKGSCWDPGSSRCQTRSAFRRTCC